MILDNSFKLINWIFNTIFTILFILFIGLVLIIVPKRIVLKIKNNDNLFKIFNYVGKRGIFKEQFE